MPNCCAKNYLIYKHTKMRSDNNEIAEKKNFSTEIEKEGLDDLKTIDGNGGIKKRK